MITLRAATDNSRGSLVVLPAAGLDTDAQHQPTDAQRQPTASMAISSGAERAAATVQTTIAGS